MRVRDWKKVKTKWEKQIQGAGGSGSCGGKLQFYSPLQEL